jgi:hypothetical protein
MADNTKPVKEKKKNLEIRLGPFRIDQPTYDKFTLGLPKADQKKINFSKLFRELVWKSEVKVIKPLSDTELRIFKELIRVSTNINQIAKALNKIAAKDIVSLDEVLDASNQIKELKKIIDYSLNQFNK